LVESLGDEYHFKIITRDRDVLDKEQYESIRPNEWNWCGKADVFYADRWRVGTLLYLATIARTRHDVVYINSFFDPWFSLFPLLARKIGVLPRKSWILAARGELATGALGIKKRKKRVVMALARLMGLHRGVMFQASSSYESDDICNRIHDSYSSVIIAPDVQQPGSDDSHAGSDEVKRRGSIKKNQDKALVSIVFLSRITKMKNLGFALQVLKTLSVPVLFHIYGPIRERAAWREYEAEIEGMPGNVKVEYCGVVEPSAVTETIAQYDLFFLPTLGENFGHVIAEAFRAGIPVLISDRTPWRNLEGRGIGWDVPLESGVESFAEKIEQLYAAPPEVRLRLQENVREWMERDMEVNNALHDNRVLFDRAFGKWASSDRA
jgi:glycosyltransferase involved in cell wall biosynthesis